MANAKNVKQQQVPKEIISHWWLMLINGISLVIIGALLLAHPLRSTAALVQLMGIYWIVAGIFNLVGGLSATSQESRGWSIVMAVIYIIAGFVIVTSGPLAASASIVFFLMYVLAFSAIINGILMIFMGRQQADGARERSIGSFLLGGFNLVIGVLILTGIGDTPLLVASSFIWASAICCILFGTMIAIMSFRLRGMKA